MLVMLGLVSMFNYIDRTVLSVLQEPIKRELGLSDGQLGLLTGLAFALFYATRSEEHTSELQSLMRISYAVFCLKKKKHVNSVPLYYKVTNNRHKARI